MQLVLMLLQLVLMVLQLMRMVLQLMRMVLQLMRMVLRVSRRAGPVAAGVPVCGVAAVAEDVGAARVPVQVQEQHHRTLQPHTLQHTLHTSARTARSCGDRLLAGWGLLGGWGLMGDAE